MDTFFKENKIFKNKFVIALLLSLYILIILPFLGNIAFDAVVHFVFAENFASGHPFLYNITDNEKVIASTSPFWTILLTFFYFIAGQFTPLIVKTLCILLWLACGYLLNIIARDIWKMKDYTRYAVLLMWFANVSVVKNSLGGLENILSAFQLLLLYYFLWNNLDSSANKTDYFIGALLGWTLLTRLDAGMLALIFVLIYLFARRPSVKYSFIKSTLIIILISLVVLLPWYLFQYSQTSKILSDSSVARLFTGRRNSIVLFNGLIFFHPKAIIIVFSVFLPISIGFLWSAIRIKFNNLYNKFHILVSIISVICAVLAYSFIVGADQFGRYFLVCMPFFLLAGFNGLQKIYLFLKDRNTGLLKILTALLIIFLFLTNGYDYYKRVINIEQLESNIYEVFYAPSNRNNVTNESFRKLGIDTTASIKLAVTEVQYKYFVDDRINVISLDGRSSPKILNYMHNNGFPDFEKFIEDEKPDVVEVKGWTYYSDTPELLPGLFGTGERENLLSSWEDKLKDMKTGESFRWKNNTVIYAVPHHVKILYNTYK